MISYEEFEDIIVKELKRDISSNEEQNIAIKSQPNESLFIVAGPGSGKTTVIVLKILKYIFVDDIAPNEIMATTFTRKAAKELDSRILSWGDQIKNYIFDNTDDFDTIKKVNRIDFNQINTGTIDSVAEDLLKRHKDPGTNLPILIESFVAKSAMLNAGLQKNERHLNKDLQDYLSKFSKKEKITEATQMSNILLEMKNRMYFDQVDFTEIYEKATSEGEKEALNAIIDYETELKNRNIMDFPMLEEKFLKNLKNNKLDVFLDDIKIILIDEYQDTNLIQEKIYFTIAKSTIKNGGNITVVGDDDQSLYRFRGATVDLFTNFKKRAKEQLDIEVKEINLRTNYRSTENIINHCNHFVELDNKYQSARVREKPKIISPNFEKDKMPILGMFRNNPEILAADLTNFINKLVKNGEIEVKVKRIVNKDYYTDLNSDYDASKKLAKKNEHIKKGKTVETIKLKLDENKGSASDIAVLMYSPKESKWKKKLFPYFLRKKLERLNKPIKVFNPRGQDLHEIEEVKIFCGLMLECIDPESRITKKDNKIPNLAKHNMYKWRNYAKDYIKLNPEPHTPLSLEQFVKAWQNRKPIGYDTWPKTTSLMGLAYKLITWIEFLQNDIEGVVYLEAITKTITQTGFFNKYSSNISFKSEKDEEESVLEAIWNIFVPIAIGDVEINERLIETLPEDRLNIMSIHQSKGLEFPLVIVDVGSKFQKNDSKDQTLRFPKNLKNIESIEDSIRLYSSLGESERSEKDRSFDDLIRLYFVAFSRAESVLMLIGLNNAIDGYKVKNRIIQIPNMALGWDRNEKLVGLNEIYLI